MLAEDEVKRVGRDARRKDGRTRRHTAGHENGNGGGRRERRKEEEEDEDAGGEAAAGGGGVGEVRERGFRSSNLPDLYVLSLHARGFTDYAPVDRARSNERRRQRRQRDARAQVRATLKRYERVARARRTTEGTPESARTRTIVEHLRQSCDAVGAHRRIRWRRGYYAFIIGRQKEMTVYK